MTIIDQPADTVDVVEVELDDSDRLLEPCPSCRKQFIRDSESECCPYCYEDV
jgi:hypothetical protein